MSSFPVLRTRRSVCFLSPFPDSLPQLFLRCLPCALAFGLFPFRSAFFRLLPVRFRLLGFLFLLFLFFPALPHSGSSSAASLPFGFLAFPLPFHPVSRVSLPFSVLSFLFVSFHPSRFRSHSRSTGASLLLSLSGFPLSSVFFRPLPFGSNYSAFRSFFSLLPVLPCRRFLRCFFPLPSSLFPCLPSDSGTQLPAFLFSDHCFASQ